ncbi:hypothetical protein PbJCM13498_19720 [Prolixibacter bellariivorans]|uniref:Zinc-finger domain-containing protein n=1 Tax=Prolixibacter bellariivorans TaxID=314319 RepID=A0A5M4AYX8_9BACT|nr:hypothetical protein [Prolixibacter bellariivorans]GET33109.1 hypothetical protein PbJCM13498_19720 [Prolixibacter bellariivorans]
MKKKTEHTINQLMNHTMLSCEDATGLISRKQHEKLTFKERVQLTIHLWSCKFCRRFERQLNYLNRVIGHLKQDADKGVINFPMTDTIRTQIDEKLQDEISRRKK